MKFHLKSDNQNLSANLVKPENLRAKNLPAGRQVPALLFIHGWGSSQEGNILRAEKLSELGFICVTIDLRGHGESDGKLEEFSRKDHLEDVLAAYDYIANLPEVDREQIGVIGASYGGYLASILAGERKIKWLVLRVPALYFDKNFDTSTLQLIENEVEAFKTSNLKPEDSLPLKSVQNFSGEILLIESEDDAIIPHSVIENYLEYINKDQLTYKIMKNTPHDLRTEDQQREYIGILKSFLVSLRAKRRNLG